MSSSVGWKPYLGKALALLGIAFVLELAIVDISSLLSERYERQQRAEEEVRRMAGGEQLIEGPVLVVAEGANPDFTKSLPIVPLKRVSIDTKVATEERYRGSYSYETLLSTVTMKGEVEIPDNLLLPTQHIAESSPTTSHGFFLLRVSERHFIQSVDTVTLDGTPLTIVRSHRPDTLAFAIPLLADRAPGVSRPLEVTLRVRGTKGISFSPLSHAFAVNLQSNSPNPSFVGAFLPIERSVDSSGSAAQWRGDTISTSLSCYRECPSVDTFFANNSSPVGAVFLNDLSVHSMVERAIRYRELFVVLTFGEFLLFEIITKVRIHPVQYLLVGGALTVYYLLLLSLAEQIGFLLAYSVAAGVIICLIAGYTAAILRSRKHGAVVGGLLMSTYAFLCTVLQEQDLALLFGSVGLTLFLAVFMFVTRQIDWYALIPAVSMGTPGSDEGLASVRKGDAHDVEVTKGG